MNTRLLMAGSALVLGLLGVAGSFLPAELLGAAGIPPTETTKLVVQVTGALYLGFAMLNWMAKDSVIGGIYARPTALGNLLHFFSATMAMGNVLGRDGGPGWLWAAAIVYAVFTVGFGLVVFRPAESRSQQ